MNGKQKSVRKLLEKVLKTYQPHKERKVCNITYVLYNNASNRSLVQIARNKTIYGPNLSFLVAFNSLSIESFSLNVRTM